MIGLCMCIYFVWGYFYKVYKGRSLLSALDLSVLETKQEKYQQSSKRKPIFLMLLQVTMVIFEPDQNT